MTKINIPTGKHPIDQKFQQCLTMYPDHDGTLEQNLLRLRPLFLSGVLTKDNYDMFSNDFRDFGSRLPMYFLRDEYIHDYGFFLVSEDFIEASRRILSSDKILEVGAGSGFLSSCLQSVGLDVTPTDMDIQNNSYGFKKLHTEILEVDSVDYLKKNKSKFDTVVMSWPNYSSSFAFLILKSMVPGQKLLYIGEGYGGCTGDDNFFELLEKRATLMEEETKKLRQGSFQWMGLHDKPYLFEIK